MRVLILGSGGREHAIGWKLSQSPLLDSLMSAPGNPGLAELGAVVPDLDILDPDAVSALATANQIDLVVVGPEAPLAAGIVDELAERGIAASGPTAAAARLEASKAYAKDVMARAGVPTARAETFTETDAACAFLETAPAPFVVKADGLAAGKGVLVTEDRGAAQDWARKCLGGGFGTAGSTVVIEDYLDGPELSVIALCDGERALPLPPARDYKRLGDRDRGPNTGGMGCYSPVTLPDGLVDDVVDTVMLPVMATLADDGITFRGFLYAGLVLTADGPMVLEFNCRLGDPETQVILPRLDEDLLALLHASATGTLPDRALRVHADAAVNIVLAAPGYPEAVKVGTPIAGTARAAQNPDVHLFHAGTKLVSGGLRTGGGRVLNVVGTGPGFASAREKAYTAAAQITFEGKQFRSDIGS
jgi:phosphoribosylamine--glycine ligase